MSVNKYNPTTGNLERLDGYTVDSAPVSGSDRPVSSGGVYTAVSGKADLTNITDIIESTATASRQYYDGDLFIYNGQLYEATTNIFVGDTITPGTNADAVCIHNTFLPLHDGYGKAQPQVKSNPMFYYGADFNTVYDVTFKDPSRGDLFKIVNARDNTSSYKKTGLYFGLLEGSLVDSYRLSQAFLSLGGNYPIKLRIGKGTGILGENDTDNFIDEVVLDPETHTVTINEDIVIGQHYDSTQSSNVNSNLTVSGIITVNGSDYAEKFETLEDCPEGRFVTLDGEKIRLAQYDDIYILGVTSKAPAIIGDKDNEGVPVGLIGKLWVEHDGTATVNDYVECGKNGIATEATTEALAYYNKPKYRVMAVDGNRCKILVK